MSPFEIFFKLVLSNVSSMTSNLRFVIPLSFDVRQTPFTEMLAPFFKPLLKFFGVEIECE